MYYLEFASNDGKTIFARPTYQLVEHKSGKFKVCAHRYPRFVSSSRRWWYYTDRIIQANELGDINASIAAIDHIKDGRQIGYKVVQDTDPDTKDSVIIDTSECKFVECNVVQKIEPGDDCPLNHCIVSFSDTICDSVKNTIHCIHCGSQLVERTSPYYEELRRRLKISDSNTWGPLHVKIGKATKPLVYLEMKEDITLSYTANMLTDGIRRRAMAKGEESIIYIYDRLYPIKWDGKKIIIGEELFPGYSIQIAGIDEEK